MEFENRLRQKPTLAITYTELRRMISEVDINKDGFVDKKEFQLLVASFQNNLSKVAVLCCKDTM